MAKITKTSKTKQSKLLQKNIFKKYDLKQCTINSNKMSKNELKMYKNANEIVTKNFSIEIKNNTLRVGKQTEKSKNGIFQITISTQGCGKLMLQPPVPSPVVKTSAAKQNFPKSLNCFISNAWNKSKKDFCASNQCLNLNDIVMARLKSYSAWPGLITGYTKDKRRAYVEFFGTHNVGSVDVKEIVRFTDCYDTIRLLLLRKTSDFHKAIIEVERIQNVPPEMSLLHDLNALQ